MIKDPWSSNWLSLILDYKFGFEIVLRGFEILGFIVLGFDVLGIVVLGSKILGLFIIILRKEYPLGFRILNPCFKDFSSWQSLQLLVILFCVTCAWFTIENQLVIWSLSMPPVLLTDWCPLMFSEKWHSAKQPNQSLSRAVRCWRKVIFQFNKQVRCWAVCYLSTLNQSY